ncbi:LOW QUALITY PROTEIN: hypothetical protein CVT25_005718, partial [Psilocybe cyanescens]
RIYDRPESYLIFIFAILSSPLSVVAQANDSQFFQIRARDDINAILSAKGEDRQADKFKFVQKVHHQPLPGPIQKANDRDRKAFNRILELAYGRVGKLKWDLLEASPVPMRHHSTSTLPEPIIRGVEKSRPPLYSPELKALFTSSLARLNKPLERRDLITPRTLPPRANPLSEEAQTFGPFSKRREVNIRRRFFQNELKKVLPPLEITKTEGRIVDAKVLLRPLGFQGTGVTQELETLIGRDLFPRPPKTRRERRSSPEEAESTQTTTTERHPSRWVRRRYRALLAHIPRLIYDPKSNSAEAFRVEKDPLGHHPHDRSVRCMPDADPVTMAWIEQQPKQSTRQRNRDDNRRKG